MTNGLAQRLLGRVGTALFGSQPITAQQTGGIPTEVQEYLDNVENEPYMQRLLNKPKHEALTLDQYKEGISQGLNFGVPEIAEQQKKLNINIPKTGEEIELAKVGEFNTYPLQSTLTAQPRQGGIFNDIASGFKENYNNGFDINNLMPQKKNFATRFGEGLGTLGRFVDSPLGRGLIAAGLNSALGYDDSAVEGLQAYVGRQNNITQDKLFRKSLVDDYGFAPEEVDGIKGNITKDLYNTIAANRYKQQSMQLKRELSEAKDNVSRARMISTMLNNGSITPREAQLRMAEYGITVNDIQESNNTKLLPYKQYAMQVAPQVAMGNLAVAQGNLGLRQQMMPYDIAYKQYQIQNMQNKGNQDKKVQENLNSLNAIKNQLDRFSGTFDAVDNPYRYRVAGGVSEKLNTLTPDESNFNSQASLLLNKIARDLGGEKGVLSDQDIARIKESMPRLQDTKAQKKAKMNAIYDLLNDRMSQYGNVLNMQNQYTNQPSARTGVTSSGVKYEVVD